MNKAFNFLGHSARSLADDHDGSQVVEYSLIVAVIAVALVVALSAVTTGSGVNSIITRLTRCLTTATCL